MSKNKSPRSRLSAHDIDVWKQMTRDVERADGASYLDIDVEAVAMPRVDKPMQVAIEEAVIPGAAEVAGGAERGRDIDHRTAERLRKGQIRPEARLDLHGMDQGRARQALYDFIAASSARGLRCVLVITGKGRSKQSSAAWMDAPQGVLHRRVPEWLHEPEMQSRVLRHVDAMPRDGGAGAQYVYLRRVR